MRAPQRRSSAPPATRCDARTRTAPASRRLSPFPRRRRADVDANRTSNSTGALSLAARASNARPQVQRHGVELTGRHGVSRCGSGSAIRERHALCANGRRHRHQLERGADNHGQAAERSGHQLAEVVSGDILHDVAARLHQLAVGRRELNADQQIPWRAEAVLHRTGIVGREHASDRCVCKCGLEREPLPLVSPARGSSPRA